MSTAIPWRRHLQGWVLDSDYGWCPATTEGCVEGSWRIIAGVPAEEDGYTPACVYPAQGYDAPGADDPNTPMRQIRIEITQELEVSVPVSMSEEEVGQWLAELEGSATLSVDVPAGFHDSDEGVATYAEASWIDDPGRVLARSGGACLDNGAYVEG